MNDRMKELRKALGLTQQEFADKLNMPRTNIGGYEIGARSPSNAVISLICREFNVNEGWLRTGEGAMFLDRTRDEQIASFIGNLQSVEDDTFKKRLISMLSEMTEDEWELLEKMVLRLAKEKD